MKFVFITPWYGMFAGGLESEFRCYAEILTTLGHEVEVLTTCSQSPYHSWNIDFFKPGEENIEGVKVLRFKTNKESRKKYLEAEEAAFKHPTLEQQYNFFNFGIASNDLVDYIATYPPEVILIAGPYFQSLSYLAITRYPQKIYLRTALHNEPQASWKPVQEMLINAKGFLLSTEAEKDLIIFLHCNCLGRKIVEHPVIGVPFYPPAYDQHSTFSAQPHESNPSELALPPKYFLYLGRKERGKGVDLLVTWYQRYIENCNQEGREPIPLVFLGGGHVDLLPTHNPNFIDLGYVDIGEKNKILAKALGLINLSMYESFSLVLMEAWSLQVPVIVNAKCEVTKEHCYKSSGGITVDSETSFCEALKTLENIQIGRAMGFLGKQYYLSNYRLSKVINNFFDLVSIPVGFQEAGEARASSRSGAYIEYVSSERSTQL